MTRRIIVHSGFHKTGTSAVQRYFFDNRRTIWASCGLILPKHLRGGASTRAVRYSRSGSATDLAGFKRDLAAVLSTKAKGNRPLIISDENLCGQMPGKDGHAGYDAAPDLMAAFAQVARDVLGPVDLQIHLTTRDAASWARSAWAHRVVEDRMTLDAADFAKTFGSVDFEKIANAIAEPYGQPYAQPYGPPYAGSDAKTMLAAVGIDASDWPPPARVHTRWPDDMLAQCLTLNRSDLNDAELTLAKHALRASVARDTSGPL